MHGINEKRFSIVFKVNVVFVKEIANKMVEYF